jgi:CO/xanthine dehydrogenase Mo-binding subunit
MAVVGRDKLRKEGPAKLTGTALYVDDVPVKNAWHGVTIRSTVPHAKIKNIRFLKGFPWKQAVVVTAKDVPGKNCVRLIEEDQPLLADEKTLHQHEPVALVAHPDRATVQEARKFIEIDYEPLPAVLSIEESLKKKRLLRGKDNVFKSYRIKKGDAKKAMKKAWKTVDTVFRVPHQEQAYIENQGMISWFEKDGTLVLLGSLQCPYYVVKAMQPIFDLPEEKIRVVQAVTGGGFGGKEEYPNMIAGHAALLARKAKRPVKIIYDRHEDMAATTKRHPAIVRHKAGIDRKGKLVALDVDIVMDGGAYITLSPVVLSRGILHASGPYECPNVDLRARCVATNTPPNGAYRGFGAPQTLFAAEGQWDRLAELARVDALKLRERNLVKIGSELSTGQILKESVGLKKCLDAVVKRSAYAKRRKDHDRWNKKKTAPTWRGIGLAAIHHGSGFTGNGEVFLKSRAAVSLLKSGRFRIEAASSEIGQGSMSTLSQIVADALGVPYEWVELEANDTRRVPDSGPTVASRTCMVVGGLLHNAALDLKAAIVAKRGKFPKTESDLKAAAKALAAKGPLRFTRQFEKNTDIEFDDKTYRGDAYGSYGYAALAVDLEVDKTTYEVTLKKVWTAQDVGKAINPHIVEGQIMGGTLQALGWAVLENPVYENGSMVNAEFTNYIIPTAMDAPPMDVVLVEAPYSRGPFGAKGVGEMPMDVPAPAVCSALKQATGIFFDSIPVTPEKIVAALRRKK